MVNADYKPRLIDSIVRKYLRIYGSVCIEGPKWCGKTWTGSYHANSEVYIDDPANNYNNRQLARLNPSLVLNGDYPRLIDEWQEVPPIWDAVRKEVDKSSENGKFILTGSSTPNLEGVFHSGTGRIAGLRMRPMSLYEAGFSSGVVSLSDIIDGTFEDKATGEVGLFDLCGYICRGGWPRAINLPLDDSLEIPKLYINSIIDRDIIKLDGVSYNKDIMVRLLKSLARNESTTCTKQSLVNDIEAFEGYSMNRMTLDTYLSVLNRLFLLDDQEPFSDNPRSSMRVRQNKKRHLADPSLATALLGLSPNGLINNLTTAGFLFEALCERDLRIYGEALGGTLYHYQDYKNNEIDAVLSFPDGRWIGFEIKLGANQIDSAIDNLLRIKALMANPPIALCVICGLSSYAYRDSSGVYVLPITALKD